MATPANVRGGYEELEVLSDPGGAIAIITQRVGRATFTASFFRMYDRDGARERTAFFGTEHMESLERMIKTARARIKELENQTQSPGRR